MGHLSGNDGQRGFWAELCTPVVCHTNRNNDGRQDRANRIFAGSCTTAWISGMYGSTSNPTCHWPRPYVRGRQLFAAFGHVAHAQHTLRAFFVGQESVEFKRQKSILILHQRLNGISRKGTSLARLLTLIINTFFQAFHGIDQRISSDAKAQYHHCTVHNKMKTACETTFW